MYRLLDEEPEKLYQKLRDQLSQFCRHGGGAFPSDHQPSRSPKSTNMDVHLADFLCFIHKYSDRLKLEWMTYQNADDLFLQIKGWQVKNASLSKSPQRFLFKLRSQTFQYGVFKQTIKSFRDVFDLPDDTEFFQCLGGDQV